MLLLIDGSNMAVRAHCAVRDLNDDDGNPVNAIYGTLKIFRSLLAHYPQAGHVVVTFDTNKSKFRRDLFPEYKKHRADKKDTINLPAYYEQVPYIMEILGLICPVITSKVLEADDLIAWLAQRVTEKVAISSTDKDMLQLVNDHVFVVDAFKREKGSHQDAEITLQNFQTVTGLPQEQYLEYRILTGDKSDNINGVPGIGEVRGTKLIKEYGFINKMREADVERLRGHWDTLDRNRKLMTLNRHLEEPESFEEFEKSLSQPYVQDLNHFREVLDFLKFRSITDDYHNWTRPFSMLSSNPIFNECHGPPKMVSPHPEVVSALPGEKDSDEWDPFA